MRYNLLFLIIILTGCQPNHDLPVTIELHSNWHFKKVSDTVWHSATVPGNVHTDLLDHELIKNPFIGDNEEAAQWVSETSWEYKTHFTVDKETLKKNHLELNFEGLDTYASVFLNDSLILNSNNAFRSFRVNVKPQLKTENDLRIVFKNTSISEDQEKAKLNYTLPEGNRIFTRKAQFQYGWDWGPKLNTSGIWRPIELVAWDDYKIESLFIDHVHLSDSIASIIVKLEANKDTEEIVSYEVYVNDSLVQVRTSNPIIPTIFPTQIKNPKRWWPHNLGEPYLHDIKVVVRDGKTVLDSISKKIGLRTIDLVTEKDSLGESFYFKVNDVPVYAKGANYIPQNSLQNKVTNTHYETLLNDVVNANMNMLRVWGGGIYENDIFYDLCDEKGILIWQDFMFACAMYPSDKAFLENVQQEATQNVKRLGNHPSLALWCGNNENSEGWHRWGWQSGRSDDEKDEIWGNYLKVFDSILPNTVKQLTNTNYWESSPKYGRGNPKYKLEGDAHDWWIWHDGYPFEHLENNVPRFMSEFGFQSLPSYETIRYINQDNSIDIVAEGFKNHQKHTRGFQLINKYMQRDFPVPYNPEDYVYVSQLLQAYGITKGIEAHRRAKPYNMGTLYWQLNDCWPAVSWSSIDFFGNWKALHYQAKHSFQDVLISSIVEDESLKIYIINDDMQAYSGTLKLKLLDFNGTEIWSSQKDIQIDANSSAIKHELDLNAILYKKENVVLVATFNNSESYFYFEKPKNLNLKQAPIKKTITKTPDGFQIELSSKILQKNVFLYTDVSAKFSDNYFDLLPNVSKTIHLKTSEKDLPKLNIKTLNSLIKNGLLLN